MLVFPFVFGLLVWGLQNDLVRFSLWKGISFLEIPGGIYSNQSTHTGKLKVPVVSIYGWGDGHRKDCKCLWTSTCTLSWSFLAVEVLPPVSGHSRSPQATS